MASTTNVRPPRKPQWQKTLEKATIPLVGLVLLILFWYSFVVEIWQTSSSSSSNTNPTSSVDNQHNLWVIGMYAVTFTIGMEYVARYEHLYLWHSSWLWFIHASHHHQEAKVGVGPSSKQHTQFSLAAKSGMFEHNDIFPVIFASTTMGIMYGCLSWGPPTLWKDCALGACVGISTYGTSYFVGHDLCAHERAGKTCASVLQQWCPYMSKCAHIHKSHHLYDKDKANQQGFSDPYGAPYGFWLGPQEMEYLQQQKQKNQKQQVGASSSLQPLDDVLPMPLWCKVMFGSAFSFLTYASCV